MKAFPFVRNFELKCKILAREYLSDDRYDYFGDRVETMRHGTYGIMLSIGKHRVLSIYEGSWGSDTYHGKGILYTISHPTSQQKIIRTMEGEWSNGVLQGKGRIKNYNPTEKQWIVSYEGDFKNGEKFGFGIERSEDSIYRGDFSKGCRTGKGRLELTCGNFFDGQFDKGFLVGESYESVGDTFIITDRDFRKKVYHKPESMDEFTLNFSKLIHQIASLRS
jgi:hypothetical protein